MLMKIGELAQKSGCRVVTIRYYAQCGLLDAAWRTSSNYRMYDEKSLERLSFIQHCRAHNLSLKEIKKLLDCRHDAGQSCEWLAAMIDGHIGEIDSQIKALQELKKNLQELRAGCTGHDKIADCAIVRRLHEHRHCRHAAAPKKK